MVERDLVTIITVVYNGVREIGQTICSVVGQDYPNLEYIIVDGASSDGTIDVINQYKDEISLIISEPDYGIYDAMNKAISHANGRWINFMNCGDSFASNDVISQIFDKSIDPKYDVIYGDTIFVYPKISLYIRADKLNTLTYKMPFCHQSVFVMSELLSETKFCAKYKIAADYNLFYSLYKDNHKFLYKSIPVSNYQLVDGISYNNTIRCYKEMCVIRNEKKNIIYYCVLLKLQIRSWLIKILPTVIIDYIRMKNNLVVKNDE